MDTMSNEVVLAAASSLASDCTHTHCAWDKHCIAYSHARDDVTEIAVVERRHSSFSALAFPKAHVATNNSSDAAASLAIESFSLALALLLPAAALSSDCTHTHLNYIEHADEAKIDALPNL